MPLASLLFLAGFQVFTVRPAVAFQMNVKALSSPADLAVSVRAAANAAPALPQNTAATSSRKGAKANRPEQPPQTLVGTVEWEYKPLAWDCDVPNCDHFAIYDDATHRNYEIDNARAALPFEGKRAKVSGVVDDKNSVVHLLSIESAK